MAAGVSVLALSTANAADLPPIYATPIYEAAPELQPVEIGNGWYLRGDVGYAFSSDVDASHREYRPDFNEYQYRAGVGYSRHQYEDFGGGDSSFDLDGTAEFSVGIGYRLTDFLRTDVTFGYAKTDFDGGSRRLDSCYEMGRNTFDPPFDSDELDCRASLSGSVQTYDLMANAYADLGTYVGFTPYVGAGVGAAQVNYEDVDGGASCSYDGSDCDPSFADFTGSYKGESSWRFAYALMGGVSYDLSQSLKLDLGYRYLNIDGGDMYSFDNDVVDAQKFGFSAEDDGFERHTIRAGVRYSLW
ncbi:probable heat resistant agglutinin 1 protein [Fulvimarina pelagi HTCC2506]|uniref:Probable heat resistant agglutinin 1 protein n=1 Tax=Fulvimarina pelagi HTCC2506 TaxID=314231 RepID=Q0G661_9HYPH|nr:outer membrane beta-barrel protein [Fulvimarina pelagi]EAU42853.1 probable heat resistant agglutinin 1 protein [Fulvimarina pelagi HTCC2506]